MLLLTIQCLARNITCGQLIRVKNAHDCLQIVIDDACRSNHASRRGFWLQTLWRWCRLTVNIALLVTQIRCGLDVSLRPLVLVSLVLTLCHDPLGFWCKCNALGQAGLPEVVHTLWVFGVANHAKFLAFVTNYHMTTVARDDWDVTTRPITFLNDLNSGHFLPLDGFLVAWALINDR